MRNKIRLSLKRARNYLAMALASLVIAALLCLYCINTLENTIMADTASTATSIQENTDSRLVEIIRFIKYIEHSSENKLNKNLTGDIQSPTPALYSISTSIRNYYMMSDLLSDTYIYYPQCDMVAGSLGCYRASSYYVLKHFPTREGYEQWKDFLLSRTGDYICTRDTPDGKCLCYMSVNKSGDKLLSIAVAELDAECLRKFLNVSSPQSAHISTGLLCKGQYVVPVASSKDCITFTSKSNYPGLFYISSYNSGVLLAPIYTVLWVCMCALFLCFISILLVSIYLSTKQSKSIEVILNKVSNERESSQIAISDEYRFISNKIDNIIAEKFKNEQQLQEYQSKLYSLFVATIVNGYYTNESDVHSLAERYTISFDYYNYRIVVIDGTTENDSIEKSCLKLQQLSSRSNINSYVTHDRNTFIILLNGDDLSSDDRILSITEKILNEMFSSNEARAGIGDCFDDMTKISLSYKQAQRALESSTLNSNHSIMIHYKYPSNDLNKTVRKKSPQSKDKEADIATRAKEIIEHEYSDSLLGLYLVAERLGVSNSYLSTAFKNCYEMSAIYYINSLRIKKAKELILHSNKTIKEISLLVGFSSDINFIRVFKKYENQTPSMLRDSTNSSCDKDLKD